jgi:predicted Zn finger-like uncharacterized protein
MIVTCAQCKTRFRIPDEKVAPEKGVKVRCTKCGNTFRVHRDASTAQTEQAPRHLPARDAVTKPEVDPFARFGAAADVNSEEATRPGVYALGVELTRQTSSPEPPSFDLTAPARRAEPRAPAPFDFSAIAPAAPTPDAPAPGAFDFSALTMPPPPRAASPPTPADATPSFDFSSLGSPSKKFAAPAELDELELPPPPAALGAWPTPTTDQLGMLTVPSPSVDSNSPTLPPGPSPLMAIAPTEAPPVGAADAFFGAPLELEGRKPLLDLPDDLSPEAAKGVLFDLSGVHPLPEAQGALARVSPSAEAGASVQHPISALRPEPLAPPSEAPRRRTVLGVVVNVAIAACLVGGLLVVASALLNDGKLSAETLSLQGLGGVFARSSGLPATDISNGLYDTKAGRAVFFVRGQVTNRGARPTRVMVQADLIEGAAVVRSASALAGAVPSPEELHDLVLDEGGDLAALAARLAPRAVELAPGAAAEFLVPFAEYPPDLEAFRVRVSAASLAGGSAALPP